MAASKCNVTRLTEAVTRQLLDSVDSVLFDCDGVIWRGDQAVPGAPEVINSLKKNGKRVFFVTNNSTKTRQMYAEKLDKLGFDASADEVFGTAYCSAVYLKNVCKLDGKVYLIGSNAMRQELEDVGIRSVGVGPDPISGVQKDWVNVPLDNEVRAVLVGFDEHFSYMKLNRALQYLCNPDCQFVGTNTDTRLPLEGGKAVPGKQIWMTSQICITLNRVVLSQQACLPLVCRDRVPPKGGRDRCAAPSSSGRKAQQLHVRVCGRPVRSGPWEVSDGRR